MHDHLSEIAVRLEQQATDVRMLHHLPARQRHSLAIVRWIRSAARTARSHTHRHGRVLGDARTGPLFAAPPALNLGIDDAIAGSSQH